MIMILEEMRHNYIAIIRHLLTWDHKIMNLWSWGNMFKKSTRHIHSYFFVICHNEPTVPAWYECSRAASPYGLVQRSQQSRQPASQCWAFNPQEEFIHAEPPQADWFSQCDLKTPPPRLSFAPLVSVKKDRAEEKWSKVQWFIFLTSSLFVKVIIFIIRQFFKFAKSFG